MATVSDAPGDEPGVLLALEEVEVAILRSLAAQLIDFVAPPPPGPGVDPLEAMVGIDPTATTPDDPALGRLLPDAFLDDVESAREFRRFTERGLRESKVAHAQDVDRALAAGGPEILITGDALGSWLGFLNDTRLTLGSRLDISEDSHDELAELPEDDPRAALFQVYDWLTFVQESIVQRVLRP